jgi:ABC-type multidrug transport system fused ATPase/permease subunit
MLYLTVFSKVRVQVQKNVQFFIWSFVFGVVEVLIESFYEFNNLSFKYENSFILKDISFKILPGETALIMGPSDAEKSTLLKLPLRCYDPIEGQILIMVKILKLTLLTHIENF